MTRPEEVIATTAPTGATVRSATPASTSAHKPRLASGQEPVACDEPCLCATGFTCLARHGEMD